MSKYFLLLKQISKRSLKSNEIKPQKFAIRFQKFWSIQKIDIQTQKEVIWNKLWIMKSRGFKIKSKILSYDLVIFQTSWCYYLEFILNFKIFSMLILTHYKPMFHFSDVDALGGI